MVVLALIGGFMVYKQVLPYVMPRNRETLPPVSKKKTLDARFNAVEKKLKEKPIFTVKSTEYEIGRDLFIPNDDFLSLFREEAVVEDQKVLVGIKPEQLPKLSIQGLIVSDVRPQAIINNQIVGIGDEVSGATVVKIKKDGVMLEYRGTYFEVKPSLIEHWQEEKQ